MDTGFKEFVSVNLSWDVLFVRLKLIWGRLSNHGGVAGWEYCRALTFAKPKAQRSGWIQIHRGGISFGLQTKTGFPYILESPGIVFIKFSRPEKSWKMSLVLESPENPSAKSWNLVGNDTDGGCNDADADTKICAYTHLYSVFKQFLCYFLTTCDSDDWSTYIPVWMLLSYCIYG